MEQMILDCCVERAQYIMLANLVQYTTRRQWSCLSRGSDVEKRGALITTHAKQLCTPSSLAKSFLAILFSSDLQ